MTYQTNNPVGSVDVRDLYDNAEAFDNFSTGPLDAYPDRFGVPRQSLQGIRNASQYVDLGPYAAGLNFTSRNQVFSYGGEFYAPGPAITLPYTTTGAGAAEIATFRSVGDATLRGDLANQSQGLGADLVARSVSVVTSVSALLTAPTNGGGLTYVSSYFLSSGIGGGFFRWSASTAKTAHNGGTIISPTVPWDGTFASLSGFFARTGESAPAGNGCWIRESDGTEILASWFGATVNDIAKDNSQVLTAVRDAAISTAALKMPIIVLPVGELTYSVSPNFALAHAMRIRGAGLDGTLLRYTGSGAAILCDSSAYGITFRTGFEVSDLLVDLRSAGVAALRLVNVDRGHFTRVMSINGAASALCFDLQLAVLCKFDSCGMTVNRWPITSYPSEVFRLAASALGQNTTACTFINCSGEGATLANWRFIGADLNVTTGGTGEAATGSGRGVLFGTVTGCKGNQIIGMTCELNPGGDVYMSGLGNQMIGGYGISEAGPGVVVSNTAYGCTLQDVITHKLTVDAGALNNSIKGLKYNARLSGGVFSDSGTGTQISAIYNMGTSEFEYPRKASFGITATLGSFVYTNATTDTVMINIAPGAGGTITQILYNRTPGENSLMSVGMGSVVLLPGDSITVSSSTVAPVMAGRRIGNGSL